MRKSSMTHVLWVLCLAAALVPFMTSAINLALPFINDELALSARTASWIPTSYMLATAILQIPCARLADIYGRKLFFGLGVALFTAFSILCGLAPTGEWLIVGRVFTGVGSAMMFGTSNAILISTVPADKRGWALGIITSVVYISLAAGPLLGGLLTTHFGWGSIFYVAACIGLLVVIGTFLFIEGEWKDANKSRFDYKGSILYGIGLFSLIYGFSQLPNNIGVALIAVGLFLLFIFAKYQQRIPDPVFNINVFLKNRVFRLSSISSLINYSATFAVAFMLSLYLQYSRGLTPKDAGLILIVQSVFQSGISLLSGRLSDKMSASLLATIGMSMVALGLGMLCFVSATTSFYYIIFVLAILGLGFGIFSSPNTNVVMSSVEQKDYSMASATIGTMRLTGQSLSMGIAMMAISLTIGESILSVEVSEQLIKSMHITFAICTVLCIIGVYTSSVRLKSKKTFS